MDGLVVDAGIELLDCIAKTFDGFCGLLVLLSILMLWQCWTVRKLVPSLVTIRRTEEDP